MGVSVARWGNGGVLVRRWIPSPWEAAMGEFEEMQLHWTLGQDDVWSRYQLRSLVKAVEHVVFGGLEDLETLPLEVVRGFGDEQGAKPIGD